MRRHWFALGGASLLLGVSMSATQAQMMEPTTLPDPKTEYTTRLVRAAFDIAA